MNVIVASLENLKSWLGKNENKLKSCRNIKKIKEKNIFQIIK